MQTSKRLFLLLLLFSLLPFSGFSQEKSVRIRIIQEDSVYEPDADLPTISLFKEGFRIQVMLQEIKGIYVFASLTDSLFILQDFSPVPGFSDLPDRLITEDSKEKELTVSNDGWCYWSHDLQKGPCGFNKKMIKLIGGQMVGVKSVKQLFFLPSGKTIKLKDNTAPLYIFFVAVDEVDAKGRPVKELSRRKVKIEWLDED